MKTEVTFNSPTYMPVHGLTYVIIGARYSGRWIFVFHNRRKGYSLPAGHIDEGEDPDVAARRELAEESGALEFTISCIATYTVVSGKVAGSGRLYYAEVSEIGEIIDTDEIGNIIFSDSIPEGVIFPEIQEPLFNRLKSAIDL